MCNVKKPITALFESYVYIHDVLKSVFEAEEIEKAINKYREIFQWPFPLCVCRAVPAF